MELYNKERFYQTTEDLKAKIDNEEDRNYEIFFAGLVVLIILSLASCKKLVEIPAPQSSITTQQVFSNDLQAIQAMSGVYYIMVNSNDPYLTTGGMTLYPGLSSDELALYDLTNAYVLEFYQNNITPQNVLLSRIWNAPFAVIYQTNAIIEGLQNSESVSDSVKQELIGEAKFVRAFVNFNLINLYSDIPFVTGTDWRKSNLLGRLSTTEIYQNIISDLKDAQNILPIDYRVAKGQRIVPNKWTATALLARVYLYLGQWNAAEDQTTQVINSNLYNLVPVLNNVFKKE